MKFKNNLFSMLYEMSNYHNDHAKLNRKYIEERLQSSVKNYYDELNKSIEYLDTKDQMRLIKKMNKEGM